MQSQTALVASKSLTLSPICIMTISVINSMTGCRLYDLSKPLLMRMSELKRVCIEEKVPSHEVKVTQRMNEHVPASAWFQLANNFPPSLKPTERLLSTDCKMFSRLIQCQTRHAHTGEYYNCFIPTQETDCPCGTTTQT